MGDRPLPLAHKQDIFRVLVSCLSNPRENVLTVVNLQVMSRQEAEAVIQAFYASTGS